MIIVHPHEVVSLRAVSNDIGVPFIHCLVSFPKCRLETAKVLQIVEQRPDHLIGVTIVKFVAFGFAKSHGHHFVTCAARGLSKWALWDFACDPRPSDPDPTPLA